MSGIILHLPNFKTGIPKHKLNKLKKVIFTCLVADPKLSNVLSITLVAN